MPPDLSSLAEALRERLVIIADHDHRDRDAAGHLVRLATISELIDALVARLPARELDPQLLHYLERRSYDKALAWIFTSASGF